MKNFKRKVLGTALSAALLVSAVAPAAFAEDETESTIPELTDIFEYSEHKSFMAGYDTGAFGATDNMTRGQAMQVIYNMLGNDGDIDETWLTDTSFTDVSADAYYYEAIGYLENAGIVTGYGDGTVGADEYITRVQLLTLLNKYVDNDVDGVCDFSDVDENTPGYDFIRNAAASGWVIGDGVGNAFRPTALVTRAEAAAIFAQALEHNDSYVPDADAADANTFSDVNVGDWYYNLVTEVTNTHSEYDNIYAAILSRYTRAAYSEFAIYDKNTVAAVMVDENNTDICYYYADVDGNETMELIIGSSVPGDTEDDLPIFTIHDIYTYTAKDETDGNGVTTTVKTVSKYNGSFAFAYAYSSSDTNTTVTGMISYTLNEDGTWADDNLALASTSASTGDTIYMTYARDADGNIALGDNGGPEYDISIGQSDYESIIDNMPPALDDQITVFSIYDRVDYADADDDVSDGLQVQRAVASLLGA